ncbi:MAG: hypothetical protein FOGNACKC_02276 [Anaerolineae bacterium]|nr:hypothetical protein [Anaerolineae bacterium]
MAGQVAIDHPQTNAGDLHRAIWLAGKMQAAGLWDGQSRLVFKSPRVVHDDVRETQLTGALRVTFSNILAGGPATIPFAALAIDAWFRLVTPVIGYDGAYIKKANAGPNAVRVNDRVVVWLPEDIAVEPMALDTIYFEPTRKAA